MGSGVKRQALGTVPIVMYEGPARVLLWAGRCLILMGHRVQFRKKGDDDFRHKVESFESRLSRSQVFELCYKEGQRD